MADKTEKREKINFLYNFKIYLQIAKSHWKTYVLLLGIVILMGLSSILVKFLFKIIIDNGTSFAAGTLAKSAFISILLIVALVYIINSILGATGNWLQLHFINRLEANMIYSLKTRFFNHIISLSNRFHTTHKTGSLISRIARGSNAMESLTDFIILNGAPLLVQIVVVSLSIAYFDLVSGISLAITSVVFAAYGLFIIQKQRSTRLEANNAEDREKANVGDTLMNIESVKYFGKEVRVNNIFAKLAYDTRTKFIKSWDYYRWLESGQAIILATGIFFMLFFPLQAFLSGKISIGTIVFIYTVYGNVTGPLFGFVWGVRRMYEAMADFQALFEYNKLESEIKDAQDATSALIKSGNVEFKDINFAYNTRKIINNLSLKIKPGEKIAIVGYSGSGKTTLVKLLYRLYDLGSGEILIDGKNIKKFKQQSLRSELSIVPQECILFDDTIYNNILFSRPSANRSEVLKAIKFAQLDKFIALLPQKEHTIVGERGVKLSGGEKQRVSIARALLANKRILILDEATSSLDSQTEHEIQQDLFNLMKGRTSIIIAHRLSTIMSADRIVVIDKGSVSQIGSHNELIRKPGIYKKLWNLQKGGYIGE